MERKPDIGRKIHLLVGILYLTTAVYGLIIHRPLDVVAIILIIGAYLLIKGSDVGYLTILAYSFLMLIPMCIFLFHPIREAKYFRLIGATIVDVSIIALLLYAGAPQRNTSPAVHE